MFTYCPNCASIFRISAAQLTRADGMVRCGECRHAYNATDLLHDDLGAVRAAIEAATAPAVEQVIETPLDYVATPGSDSPAAEHDIPATIMPPQSGWNKPETSSTNLLNSGFMVALLALLAVQWTWFNRAALAGDETLRPAVERFCRVLGCGLPLAHNVGSLTITSRDVRRHPTADNALLINAVFENDSRDVQQYPVFEISFTDRAGKPVAMRRFRAEEYLRKMPDSDTGIEAGASVQVVLEVVDPGEQAVSFQFGFL